MRAFHWPRRVLERRCRWPTAEWSRLSDRPDTARLEVDRRVISVVQLESSSGNGNGNGNGGSDTPGAKGGADTDDHAPWEPRYDPTGTGEGHRIVVERVAPVRHGMASAVEVELRLGSVSAV